MLLSLLDATSSNNMETSFSTSVVDGAGLWKSWCRNFSKPLTAHMDLLDNAIDAAGTSMAGQISIQREGENGLLIYNTCDEAPKRMSEIMVAYKSSKMVAEIGQNGVGLKQGCACLAQLSFCITKVYDAYSLGIMAETLQTDTRLSLPSIDLHGATDASVRDELEELCEDDEIMRLVLGEYGRGSVEQGITKLLHHMTVLREEQQYERQDFCFALIMDKLKHSADNLLQDLQEQLQFRYLHIPPCIVVKGGRPKRQFLLLARSFAGVFKI